MFVEWDSHEGLGQLSEVVLEQTGHRVRVLLRREVHVLALVEPGGVFVHQHRTPREPEYALHRQYCNVRSQARTSVRGRAGVRACGRECSNKTHVLRSLSM